MNEKKAKEFRRIEAAHERFAGILLALGMPPECAATVLGRINWYDNDYRERVASFYVASFTSAPKPKVKAVKKFVRSYMRWLRRQHNTTLEKWEPEDI